MPINIHKSWKYGQNFLQSDFICRKIVNMLKLSEKDCVIEIGPGQLALTNHLLTSSCLTLIEADETFQDLYNIALPKKVKVIFADATCFNFKTVLTPGVPNKVVSNLPFNSSKFILKNLIENYSEISNLVLMFQKEVSESILNQTTALGAYVNTFFQPVEKLFVSSDAFRPRPKVNAMVIAMVPNKMGEKIKNKKQYLSFLQHCFSSKRKKINNVLQNCPVFIKDLRPHEISIETYIELYNLQI